MLREIVVDHQRMPLGVAEMLSHGARRIGRNVLHRRRFRCRCRHHDGVLHRSSVFQNLHNLRNRRSLLTDRVVNTNQIIALAVDDGIERHRSLAGLPVANDQLALSAANRNHAVDGLEPSRHRLTHRLPVNNPWSQTLQRNGLIAGDGPFVVDGLAQGIHDAAHQSVADGHAHDVARALYLVAFFDLGVFAKDHHAHLVFFQVHGDTGHTVWERKQFSGHDFVQAIHASDTVAQCDDRASLVHRDLRLVVLDLLADQSGNFVCLDLCHRISSSPLAVSFSPRPCGHSLQ